MNLEEFHHGIRAARNVLRAEGGGSGEMIVMGSQSILAAFPERALDERLKMSNEVDVMPVAADAHEIARLSDYLHGSLGQDSQFQESHGFHVDGVAIETSVLPRGWVDRLIPVVDPASRATAWCLDPHDLAAAKLIASRPKDVDYVAILIEHRLIDPAVVAESLQSLDDHRVERARSTLSRLAPKGVPPADRPSWHARRRAAIAERRQRATEPSPAEVLDAVLRNPRRPR